MTRILVRTENGMVAVGALRDILLRTSELSSAIAAQSFVRKDFA
jgi:hypothetical protein